MNNKINMQQQTTKKNKTNLKERTLVNVVSFFVFSFHIFNNFYNTFQIL